MKIFNKILVFVLSFLCIASGLFQEVPAQIANIEGNNVFHQDKIPVGKTGKIMNITFYVLTGSDYEDAWAGISFDEDPDAENESFPFELVSETTERKHIGKITKDKKKSITLSARVRRDVAEGYYGINVYLADDKDGSKGVQEKVNVYIQKTTDTTSSGEEPVKDVDFAIGEGQSAPRGTYPNVMNFSLDLRNKGKVNAYNVTASMVLDKDSANFPFEINEASYDRNFDKVDAGQTVSLDYSFAIRKDSFSGYYPIKLNISYRESPEGELKKVEDQFFVYVKSKEKEGESSSRGDFNPNDRTKARLIVESFRTDPETIIAGTEFELHLVMKNASSDVGASNILFSFESEKIENSAVFTSDSGSNSVAVNSMGPNQTHEVVMHMQARAGVDQRSYSLTINEQYDSPEFKNATDKVSIDIPVKEIAKLNVGNFEISPESLRVGDEANVGFPINNTGKVTLYNVIAKFSADSIKPNETYVGNIKTGETGNVDIMLTGDKVTEDDGKINLTISYEDENGVVTEVEKEFTLYVTAAEEESDPDDVPQPDVQKKAGPNIGLLILIVLAVLIVAGIVIAAIVRKRREKKEENEIS